MEKFLYKVAKDLKRRIGRDMAGSVVIFPNKRAALFFNKYLVDGEDEPLWAPKYMTISELFREMQPGITVPDTVELVCRLYNCYVNVMEKRKDNGDRSDIESLDYFYQWGETLLSDFDDIDKNMADSKKLLTNINDWNQLESSDFIDSGQEDIIKKFFSGFSIENMSILRKRFTEMWNNLYDIYTSFRESLEKENLAYEGALYRKAVELLDEGNLMYSNYIFVGFNVLDSVEDCLFEKLQDAGKALFYWDYSERYMSDNEAGKFIRHNLAKYPNALGNDKEDDCTNKEIVVISTKTDNIQAQYTRSWLENNLTEEENDTAVVLCNEKQLQPVLHAIPENVRCINVTMGYPLGETPAMSFVQCLTGVQSGYDSMRNSFSYDSVAALLKHPYMSLLSSNSGYILQRITKSNIFYPTTKELSTVDGNEDTVLKFIFTPQRGNLELCKYLTDTIRQTAQNYSSIKYGDADIDEDAEAERTLYRQLYGESLFRLYTTITRISNLIENGLLKVEREMLLRLIDRVLQGITIPFHGEPAIGLQLMGMLETRNLDFRNILMLGVNEGMLPKASEIPSFIPPTIRKGFGMTTPDRRISVFAYYFYRLLQRCEKIYFVYNDETTNTMKGEMSRFLLQLITNSDIKVRQQSVASEIRLQKTEKISIPRSSLTLDKLKRRFRYEEKEDNSEIRWIAAWLSNHGLEKPLNRTADNFTNLHILSPSAINTYIDCQLKFYYKYIAGLKIKDDVTVDIDSAMFGTIFHSTAEEVYNRLTGKGNTILKSDIVTLCKKQENDSIPDSERTFCIEPVVDFYFRKFFFKQRELENVSSFLEQQKKNIICPQASYNGTQLINKEVIVRLIKKLLLIDCVHEDFNYLGSEVNISRTENIRLDNGETIKIKIGGNIDRLDYDSNRGIRLIDYKTGTHEAKANETESLFKQMKDRSGYHLQTFLYASILCDMVPENIKIAPILLYIQKQNRNESPRLMLGKEPVDDFRILKDEFDAMLRDKLKEIFSTTGNFEQTEIEDNCRYCDFRQLCKR